VKATQIQEEDRQKIALQKVIDRIWNLQDFRGMRWETTVQTTVEEIGKLLNLDRCCFLWYFFNTKQVKIVCDWVRGNQDPLDGGQNLLEKFSGLAEVIASGELIVNGRSGESATNSTTIEFQSRLPCFRSTNTNQDELGDSTTVKVDLSHILVGIGGDRISKSSQEESRGYIACLCGSDRSWSIAEIECVQLVAQQMEIAIRQIQVYEQTEKLLAQEQLVNQITSHTRQSFELETILTEAIAQLLEALAVDRCLVHMVEDAGDLKPYRQPASSYCETTHRIAHRRRYLYEVCRENFAPSIDDFHPYGPLTQWTIQHRQLVAIADITKDPRIGPDNQEYKQAEIKSSLVVPVQTKDKLHAILYLNQCDRIRNWTKNDQELAVAVANQLAISIQQACLFAQTRASMEREALLRLIGNQIRSTLDLKTILQTAVREVRELLETDRAIVYQFAPNWRGDVVVEQVGTNWLSILNKKNSSQSSWMRSQLAERCFSETLIHQYQKSRVRIINDVSGFELADSDREFLQQLQVKASVTVPILIGDRLWGLLIIHECQGYRLWQTSEVELLQQVAMQVAIAIQQAELYQQAKMAAQAAQSKTKDLEKATAALQQANKILENEIRDRQQAQLALRQKNKIVKLLQVVAATANAAPSSEVALQTCIEHICTHTGWSIGHVYLPDREGELIPTCLWYLQDPERFTTFRQITEATRFAPGIGLPGQVLLTGKPCWITNVDAVYLDPIYPRAKSASDLGVKAGFAFPVLVGVEVVAVLEFFSSHGIEADEQLLELVGNIGTQLGRVVERERSEKALRASEARAKEQAYQLEQTLYKLKQTQTQLIQTEKMSSLGALVAGVAHEINNPVNFIYGNLAFAEQYVKDLLGLVELYQKHYPDADLEILDCADTIDLPFIIEDLPQILESMQVGAERIRQIVLTLRNFSRIDQANVKPVDIHEGIDSTLLILKNRLKAKDGYPEIVTVKEYGDLPKVECFPGQLNQVFMNLLSNAIDALEESVTCPLPSANHSKRLINYKPTIRIQTALQEETVIVRITDNGLGMSENIQAKLFDPFFTTKPVGKGTGLGLSISYQIIVEKHQGSIRCISAPGQGTEFWIEIPLRQNQERRDKLSKNADITQ
jgi:signal transduction histidine kinase